MLKQLVLQFIQNVGEKGAKRDLILEHIKDILPAKNTKEQNKRLVGNILVEMSDEGSILQKDRTWFATTKTVQKHD